MKKFIFILALFGISIFAFACGNSATSGKTVKTGTAGNMTVTLATDSGVIKDGDNDFTLTFTDASSKPVDVGAVSVNFHMPAMGTMPVMNDPAWRFPRWRPEALPYKRYTPVESAVAATTRPR